MRRKPYTKRYVLTGACNYTVCLIKTKNIIDIQLMLQYDKSVKKGNHMTIEYKLTVTVDDESMTITAPTEEMLLEKLRQVDRFIEEQS